MHTTMTNIGVKTIHQLHSLPYSKFNTTRTVNANNDDEKPLTDEEKEELKTKVAQAAYRVVGTCCSQCFFLVILCVLIVKIQGAGYSWLVIISPFLAAGGVVLCCLACTIFCLSEVDENAGLADFDTRVNEATAAAGYGSTQDAAPTNEQAEQQPQQHEQQEQQSVPPGGTDAKGAEEAEPISKPPPTAMWDPEKGEVWQNTTQEDEEETNAVSSAPKQQETDLLDTDVDAQPASIEPKPSEASEDFDLD